MAAMFAQRPLARRRIVLERGVFGGQPEGVPAHGVQHVVAAHPHVPGQRVADGVVAHVAHVQLAAGIGQHLQHVVLGLVAGGRLRRIELRGRRPTAAAIWSQSPPDRSAVRSLPPSLFKCKRSRCSLTAQAAAGEASQVWVNAAPWLSHSAASAPDGKDASYCCCRTRAHFED